MLDNHDPVRYSRLKNIDCGMIRQATLIWNSLKIHLRQGLYRFTEPIVEDLAEGAEFDVADFLEEYGCLESDGESVEEEGG